MDWNRKKPKKGRFADLCGVSAPSGRRAGDCSATLFHWALILASLTFEGLAVWFFSAEKSLGGMSFEFGVVVFHIIASLVLPFALYPSLPKSYREDWWLSLGLIFGISSTLPLFGPVCVLLILKLLNKTPNSQPSSVSRPFVTGSRVPSAEEHDFVSEQDGSQSILQIMVGPDPIARRNLILATKRLGAEDAIPILRTGLRDEDDEVKLYSQGILSKLVEQYEKSIAELKLALEKAPEETDLMVRLAELYFDIVELDLITDSSLQRFYIKRSVALLKQVTVLDPNNEEAILKVIKYHLRLEQTTEAAACLQSLKDKGVASELIEPFEIELLFLSRSWDSFRTKVRDGMLNHFCDPGLRSVEEFWFGGGARIERSRLPRAFSSVTG